MVTIIVRHLTIGKFELDLNTTHESGVYLNSVLMMTGPLGETIDHLSILP